MRGGCRRTRSAAGWRCPGSGSAQGEFDEAVRLLDEAERLYVADYAPDVRPVAALRARVWLAQGRLADALGWARERELSADDDLSYLREFDHITLATVLLAKHQEERDAAALDDAARLLQRLLPRRRGGAADRTGHRDPGAPVTGRAGAR